MTTEILVEENEPINSEITCLTAYRIPYVSENQSLSNSRVNPSEKDDGTLGYGTNKHNLNSSL